MATHSCCDVIKNYLNYSRHRKHRKCEDVLSRETCFECLPTSFTYCQTISKTRDSFVNWTCGQLSQIVPLRLYWASDHERFKIASYVAPQSRYLYGIQIRRVNRCPLFLFNHLRTVLIEARLRDMCNAHTAPCLLLNLRSVCMAAVGYNLQ